MTTQTLFDTYKAIRVASARLCLMREDAQHSPARDAEFIAAIDNLWAAAERVAGLCDGGIA